MKLQETDSLVCVCVVCVFVCVIVTCVSILINYMCVLCACAVFAPFLNSII